MKYDNIMTLSMGDPYADGHGMSEKINISTNLNKNEITKSYQIGKKKLSFDFDGVAEDYEDSHLSKVRWEEFLKLGFNADEYVGDFYDNSDEESDLILDAEGFAKLYLFIVKMGNDKFEYEILTSKQNPIIEIGGYGLFSR